MNRSSVMKELSTTKVFCVVNCPFILDFVPVLEWTLELSYCLKSRLEPLGWRAKRPSWYGWRIRRHLCDVTRFVPVSVQR